MKKSFTSGLIILLPIVLTVMIVNFFVNLLTQPFLQLTNHFLEELIAFPQPLILFHQSTLITLSSKILILLIIGGFIILIGLFGELFLINLFFRFSHFLLTNLPIVNKVYQICQEVVSSLFSSTSKQFSLVVLAPFPQSQSFCIGLVANEMINLEKSLNQSETLISVFIPGTPNPTVGYLLMYKREELIFLNMSVEEAMKFIVSCGIVMPIQKQS